MKKSKSDKQQLKTIIPTMEIQTLDFQDEEAMKSVFNGLLSHNEKFAPKNKRDFTVIIRDNEVIVGVAMGESKYDWLILQYLWVEESFRGKGLGILLLQKLDELALNRNLIGIHTDTFEFQAREFYEKAGYKVFGEIANHPRGYKRYFLKKLIASKF